MAALLGVPRQDVDALCVEFGGDGVLQAANYNDPGQTVIAGETRRVKAAMAAVKERRLGRAVPLKVSAPFHCRMLAPAAERLAEVLAPVACGDFAYPVISNVTAEPHTSADAVKGLLIEQVCAPARVHALRGRAGLRRPARSGSRRGARPHDGADCPAGRGAGLG